MSGSISPLKASLAKLLTHTGRNWHTLKTVPHYPTPTRRLFHPYAAKAVFWFVFRGVFSSPKGQSMGARYCFSRTPFLVGLLESWGSGSLCRPAAFFHPHPTPPPLQQIFAQDRVWLVSSQLCLSGSGDLGRGGLAGRCAVDPGGLHDAAQQPGGLAAADDGSRAEQRHDDGGGRHVRRQPACCVRPRQPPTVVDQHPHLPRMSKHLHLGRRSGSAGLSDSGAYGVYMWGIWKQNVHRFVALVCFIEPPERL